MSTEPGISTPGAKRAGRFDRSLGLTVVVGIALALVLGLVFSVAYGSRRITLDAGALHDADETLRSATVARAQLALAVHMASVDREFGTSTAASRQLSMDEAEEAFDDIAAGIVAMSDDGERRLSDEFVSAATAFDALGRQILDLLDSGDSEAAQHFSDTALGATFDEVTAQVIGVRDQLRTELDSSDQILGRIGNAARFLVAFLIPGAVMLLYRELMRRQQRQTDLESKLETEQELSSSRKTFIANASHELRTPLTSIMGIGLILAEKEEIRDDPALAELIDVVVGESEDLARMIEDLLTMARLDAGALHYAFDDILISSEAQDAAGSLTRSGLDVKVDCVPALVRVDPGRLRQVIRNLLSNARKYGGDNIRIEGRVEGRTYRCGIIDDGDGIPDELVPRLFERFIHRGQQTGTKDSVGLGLSIVQALVRGMGGSIVYERIDHETHFSVRFPLSDDGTEG